LRALFADPEAWTYVDCDQATAETLPGAGLHASDLAVVA
jgi:hypothetical protein